jgi:hypothetical protein
MLGVGQNFLCKGFDALDLDWTGLDRWILALAFSERIPTLGFFLIGIAFPLFLSRQRV